MTPSPSHRSRLVTPAARMSLTVGQDQEFQLPSESKTAMMAGMVWNMIWNMITRAGGGEVAPPLYSPADADASCQLGPGRSGWTIGYFSGRTRTQAFDWNRIEPQVRDHSRRIMLDGWNRTFCRSVIRDLDYCYHYQTLPYLQAGPGGTPKFDH